MESGGRPPRRRGSNYTGHTAERATPRLGLLVFEVRRRILPAAPVHLRRSSTQHWLTSRSYAASGDRGRSGAAAAPFTRITAGRRLSLARLTRLKSEGLAKLMTTSMRVAPRGANATKSREHHCHIMKLPPARGSQMRQRQITSMLEWCQEFHGRSS
jgi:hypothetical protein